MLPSQQPEAIMLLALGQEVRLGEWKEGREAERSPVEGAGVAESLSDKTLHSRVR